MDTNFRPRRGFKQQKENQSINWQRPQSFQEPNDAAQSETQTDNYTSEPAGGASGGGKRPRKSFKAWLKGLSKKQLILLIVALIIVLAGAGVGAYYAFFKEDPKPAPVAKKEVKKPAPKPLVSTLTGLPISDATVNKRPVTGVMIENSPDARPQSGLNQAGVVFEAIAEGGITRFLTLFQDTEPDYIGPVRSVRPYYVQWAAGFDAAIAHVGGSADGLRMLREGVAKDLDQFANPGPYHRISSRYAPHNMYSNVVLLRDLQNRKGFTSTYTGFARKAETKASTPNATSIDFNISGAVYNPHYDYDAATNTYKRSEGGKPHIDERSGKQLSPKVVIALVLPQGRNGVYTTYNTLGSGQAFIFQDGVMTPGNWHKASNKAQFTFTGANGKAVKLNPGQTWLSAVGGADRVTYK